MRIVMVGAGYVGLVSGACFADAGHNVVCIDSDPNKVADLKQGVLPIYEPGLDEVVARNMRDGRLCFDTDAALHVCECDAIFIAVGTPARHSDGYADLSYVYAVARDIAPALPLHALVVIKSTVPVGSSDEVERIIAETCPDLDFAVASNPEFLRAGAALEDFRRPDRIVIGTDDASVRRKLAEIYAPLCANAPPILYTSRRTAELIKYAANAFLATKIAFINEMADVCERANAEVQDLARGIGLDHRIGMHFLNAGPGFGGSCFPKDTLALVKIAQDHELPLRIVETVIAANEARKRAIARRVAALLGGSLRGKTVAVLGLTFKANTDDMREAPSIALINALTDMGAIIRAYDPASPTHARALLPREVMHCDTAYAAAKGAHAMVVVTEWEEFRSLDLDRLHRRMAMPVIVDLRNVYSPEQMAARGFTYYQVGRPAAATRSPAPAALPRKRAVKSKDRLPVVEQRANPTTLRLTRSGNGDSGSHAFARPAARRQRSKDARNPVNP